jgi:hypothetical protein
MLRDNEVNKRLAEVMRTGSIKNALTLLRDKPGDQEVDHIVADQLLTSLLAVAGYEELVEIFEAIPKWYA